MATGMGAHEHGCYQCGSADGSFERLCPQCTAAFAERRSKLRQELHVDTTGERDPFVFRVLTMPVAFGLSAILVSTAVIIGILLFASQYGISEITLLLAITAALTFLLAVGAWVAVWLILKHRGAQCSTLALFCPFLFYRPIIYASRTPDMDEVWNDVRIVFTAHILGIVLFVSTLAVSWTLDVNIFRGRSYVKTLQH